MGKKLIVLTTMIAFLCAFVISPETTFAAAKPAKVPGVKAASASNTAIKVSWKKAKNAKKYKVYMSTSKKGKYNCVATVKSSTKNATIPGLTSGNKYYFKVRGINGSKKGSFSKIVSSTPKLEKPKLTAKVTSSGVNLTSSKVPGADGYVFYRNGSTIKTTTNTTYTDTKMTWGKIYSYEVRAYKTISGNKVYSSYSNVKSVEVIEEEPVVTAEVSNLKASETTANTIKLIWDCSNDADTYYVYRGSKQVGSTENKYFIDEGLTESTEYKYYIIAELNGTKYKSNTISASTNKGEPWSLDYSANGSNKTTRIYLGQAWDNTLFESLAKNSSGEDTIYRPKYLASDNAGNTPHRDTYYYCFDTGLGDGGYDNFLAVIVCDNTIYGWVTNGSIIAYNSEKTYHWGDISNDDGIWAVGEMDSASSKWFPNLKDGGIIVGEVDLFTNDGEDFDISNEYQILSEEQKYACHLLSAMRATIGLSPVELNTYLCGDGKTYGAQAMAETLYESLGKNVSGITHDSTKLSSGPLAGQTLNERGDYIGDVSNGYICMDLECIAGVGQFAESIFVYTSSFMHMSSLMNNKEITQFGFGLKEDYNVVQLGKPMK